MKRPLAGFHRTTAPLVLVHPKVQALNASVNGGYLMPQEDCLCAKPHIPQMAKLTVSHRDAQSYILAN